ncbi:hypothetical protein O0L34_g3666 [Tuta absoluta]|nr:hypothetical protein O0L34_g3666 [Tuta absoluta]
MSEEMAQQVLFHAIFGTFKEDFGILEQITYNQTWFTREEIGQRFRSPLTGTSKTVNLIKMRYYSKMSCANQSGLLTGVYNQVSTVPCFSGKRQQFFSSEFFEYMERREAATASAKSLVQIIQSLTSTLKDLQQMVRDKNGLLAMGTTSWRDMETLKIDEHGTEVAGLVLRGNGKMFLGRPLR